MKLNKSTFVIAMIGLSFNASASVVSTDWKTDGDKLLTKDTATGFVWLDLTETVNMSYTYVNSQLGTGGEFEGFRYATNVETIALWDNFFIDLREGREYQTEPGRTSTLEIIGRYLGDTWTETQASSTIGSIGMTSESSLYGNGYRDALGAYSSMFSEDNYSTTYWTVDSGASRDDIARQYMGSYLVQTSAVPVPAAAWLFGSGLLGLVTVARRNKTTVTS